MATSARSASVKCGASRRAATVARRLLHGPLQSDPEGAGVSGLNPKALLLFLALLRQFITRSPAWPLAAQIVLLGLVHTANCAVIYTSGGHHGTAGTADTSSRRQSGDLLFTIEVQDG
jgi:threonine/homoserine/homoserine lactone efflux protein